MGDYFGELAALLRERGVPAERVTATIDDLTAYVRESGTEPEEEFGPAAGLAPHLGGDPGTALDPGADLDAAGGPGAALGRQTWVWTTDVFVEERRLGEFGDQGWEVERVDRLGRFVCHREPDRPQRWEYRREVVTPAGRPALIERLAPDDWEPCGTWVHYQYFKRPRSAELGPAAELAAPAPRPAGRFYFGRRFYLLVALTLALVAVAVVGIGRLLTATTPIEGGDFAAGAVLGAVLAVLAAWLVIRRAGR
jgi:hypothetical protein